MYSGISMGLAYTEEDAKKIVEEQSDANLL